MNKLFIDFETYSDIDLQACGMYKYMESIAFEILILAYALNKEPVKYVDLTKEDFPADFMEMLRDPNIEKHAHNASFERNALKTYGIDIPVKQWRCTAVKSLYCGLPYQLDAVSKALNLGEAGKSASGKALIKLFSCPVKPTKRNGYATRIYPQDEPEKWQMFIDYCVQDVEAERNIDTILEPNIFPPLEQRIYELDQRINDRGVLIDVVLAENAVKINDINIDNLIARSKKITGVENPNSDAQLKAWITERIGIQVTCLDKEAVPGIIEAAQRKNLPDVVEALEIRKKTAKTSIKKYVSMLACYCKDLRARGIHQFYGANRTGRWAGRIIQPQNMPKNFIDFLEEARQLVLEGCYDTLHLMYGEISNVLSQLTRTAIVAPEGKTLAAADFSAIEARVIAWLSGQKWRLDVFSTHGKIYEASAAAMFNVPIESVTKDSDYRAKGKIAELALGYQGSVGAMLTMGAAKMGLTETEMKTIVDKWRAANPDIVALWKDIERCAMTAISTGRKIVSDYQCLIFECNGDVLTIKLPSGRKLFYQSPSFTVNKWNRKSIRYKGMNQETKKWEWVDTYGGKLVENIVQAIARDILADAMLRLELRGYDINMHVHDEAIAEVFLAEAEKALKEICEEMGRPIPWAPGLPLAADGYLTPFYMKA